MLRLALIGGAEDSARYARLAPRLRGGRVTAVVDGASASVDALLRARSEVFDAVVICSSVPLDAALCRRAAEAGKHILLESPLTLSSTAAREIVAACAGVRLMFGQELRFLPALRTVKETLD